jgi:hypothetical protein
MQTLRACLCVTAAAALSFATAALAQMPACTQAGPVPPALAKAKTIFVSNAGADSGLFFEPFADDPGRAYIYSGDPDRAYTEFYAALEATGKFKLVSNPEIADLVLELRLAAPQDPVVREGEIYPLPMFRLVVYDGKSHYILWTVTRSIDSAILRKNSDKNFDAALAEVLSHFLQITGKSPVPAH